MIDIIIIMNPNINRNYYMDTGDENVTYIPVKVKSNSNVFDDTDILMKEVRLEQNAPPVYYAYKCMPIQFPLSLRGIQYEESSNLSPLQKTPLPKQLYSTKELDEYDAREVATSTIVPSPQKISKSVDFPKQKLGPQFAHDKNLNFAAVRPQVSTTSSSTTNNDNNERRELIRLTIDNDLVHGRINETQANVLRNNLI
ncbi:nesp127 [Neophasia sp. alphabaculovirus]|nr:nesp127 [Neophasia sp. alphabaculovirus]